MKQMGIVLLMSTFFCGALCAQTPEKKQEENKSTAAGTGAKSDSSKAGVQKSNTPKDTRMAITQKGVPSGKAKTNDAVKSNTNAAKPKTASGQSK